MKAQDEDKIRRQLEVVQQWRASGMSTDEWAAGHGMDPKKLMGWITYEGRWLARLSGQSVAPSKRRGADQAPQLQTHNFIALRVEPPVAQVAAHMNAPAQTVRIECPRSQLVLHWPLCSGAELAGLLKGLRT